MCTIKIAKMQSCHKRYVKKIAYESLNTLTEKFYFRLTLMFDNIFIFHVALHGDVVVGFVSAITTSQDGVVIGNIAVTARHKRKGIANLLLRNCLESYQGEKITLQVRESNIVAQSLYAKFGFEKVDVVKNYYPIKGRFAKENGLVMVRR